MEAPPQGGKNNGEVRYRGIRRTYETAEEAARAYDRAAFAFRGHSAILNFPNEYQYQNPTLAPSSSASSSAREQGTQVIEFECLDNKLLEDLLETQEDEQRLRNK
ncbi:hypothetical protein V6N13_146922 [Hibiscus sabdariffa]|uniref:AP2/ERF domain-containing protein n=1 Tax=Hibiscus sabdariffa TaxID=183260 RepID=A0ABR2TUA7_9ROSI